MKYLAIAFPTMLLTSAAAGGRPLEAQAPPNGHFQSVNGMEMYYEVRGAGPPLVLLHGFFGCGRFWQPLVEPLSRHYRVVMPDLRGHGYSTNPSGQFTHRQSASDVFALLDHLGITQFKAMGFSTGGMTLLHMATQQPDRVEAMILISATTYFPEPARGIMRQISAPDSLPPEVLNGARQCLTRGEAQIRELTSEFHQFKDSYEDMNFTPPHLHTITARTLIVHGDRDVFFPVDIPVGMYGSIPRSYLWIVPNAPHGVPILGEMAEQFQDAALSFFDGKWQSQ